MYHETLPNILLWIGAIGLIIWVISMTMTVIFQRQLNQLHNKMLNNLDQRLTLMNQRISLLTQSVYEDQSVPTPRDESIDLLGWPDDRS